MESIINNVHKGIRKVPEITVIFWIVKVLTTAVGEATSDYLVHRYNPYFVVFIGAFCLAIALLIQLKVVKYIASIYWLAVAMVAVFGTMAADVLHIELGIPYLVSSIFLAIVLTCIFIFWNMTEKTLSIHSIYTKRRELFYWATVLATFALGTAVGDMTAVTLGLGYLSSGLMFAILIAIPALAYWLFKLNDIVAFWLAYILTRPLGASFADWFSVSHIRGGLNMGYGTVSLGLTLLIICFVIYLSFSQIDLKK
jgi:uncharacterized membrane-anchored protein